MPQPHALQYDNCPKKEGGKRAEEFSLLLAAVSDYLMDNEDQSNSKLLVNSNLSYPIQFDSMQIYT